MLYSQAMFLSSLQAQEQVPLAPYTTLQVGGAARYFLEVVNEEQVEEAVAFASERSLPLFILGGGSNLLVSDAGFAGVVLHIAMHGILEDRDDTGVRLEVGAGEGWNDVVLYAVERSYAGIECLAGIPGNAGGTPVQNVGAYGQEVAETITRVRAYDLQSGCFVEFDSADCHFGYRRSLFNTEQRGRYIITKVVYRLQPEGKPELRYADLQRYFKDKLDAGELPKLRAVYDAVRSIREQKGMLAGQGGPDGRSAGSFFKNPVVPLAILEKIADTLSIPSKEVPHWPAAEGRIKLSAAWLIEKAGFVRGFALGRAGISSRHTLALINRGDATASEIFTLRDAIQGEVKRLFAIQLEQEPVQLGE